MPRYRGLTVVGENLDHALVYEYPQGEVLTFLQLERRIDIANCQGLARVAGRDCEDLVRREESANSRSE